MPFDCARHVIIAGGLLSDFAHEAKNKSFPKEKKLPQASFREKYLE